MISAANRAREILTTTFYNRQHRYREGAPPPEVLREIAFAKLSADDLRKPIDNREWWTDRFEAIVAETERGLLR